MSVYHIELLKDGTYGVGQYGSYHGSRGVESKFCTVSTFKTEVEANEYLTSIMPTLDYRFLEEYSTNIFSTYITITLHNTRRNGEKCAKYIVISECDINGNELPYEHSIMPYFNNTSLLVHLGMTKSGHTIKPFKTTILYSNLSAAHKVLVKNIPLSDGGWCVSRGIFKADVQLTNGSDRRIISLEPI